jgi:hypothetical protein
VNKLRKALAWLWRNKERIVLVILVGALVWQLYKIVGEAEAGFESKPLPPRPPREGEYFGPEEPPPPPPLQSPEDWSSLVLRNAFWLFGTDIDGPEDGEGGDDPGIALLQIRPWSDGGFRARLETESAKKWYGEGEKFESFELLHIYPDENTVEVYSEELGRTVTLTAKE